MEVPAIFNSILRVLLFVVSAYFLLAFALFVFQRNLIYLPTRGEISDRTLSINGLTHWPAKNNYRGYLAHPNNNTNNVRGTVIVFHGNAGNASDRRYYSDALTALGYRVLIIEYPGYGARRGSPGEQEIVSDGVATLGIVREQYGGPIFILGESLGAGVAAAVLAQTKQNSNIEIAGIALLTPWDSLTNLAGSIYWFMPVRWLLRDRYESVDNLREFSGRVAMITAAQDRVIPNIHSERLFESIGSQKRRWHFEKSGHNDWPSHPQADWWREMMDFLDPK
ncbi:MAG: alpha/beta hydrolase [Pseudomonadota bacterium]